MLINFRDLPDLRRQQRDKIIVLGSGVFDLVHCGHVQYLQGLRKYGEVVVVMVKSDARVRLGKGPSRPVLPEQDRALMVDAIKGVDYTFIAPHHPPAGATGIDPTYEAVFRRLDPDVFFSTNPTWQQLEVLGKTKVVITERPNAEPLRSTTAIIEQVKRKSSEA